jgi:hypothetical protein
MATFEMSGKLGDCVLYLPTLRALAAHDVFNEVVLTDKFPFFSWDDAAPLLQPLLAAQPYIHSVRRGNLGDGISLDTWWLDDFRTGKLKPDGSWNIASLCLDRFHLPHSALDAPWLTPSTIGRPADYDYYIARNAQPPCANVAMPWRKILERVGRRCCFLGLRTEWERFCGEFGHVDYKAISHLYDAANLMAGGKAVFCNHSVFQTIAEGLKKPIMLEVHSVYPGVIFRRPGAVYAWAEHNEWPDPDQFLESLG